MGRSISFGGSFRSPTSSTVTIPHRQRQAGCHAAARGAHRVELSDIIFAVDSVPAILAVSNETFIVFASNAFAILGLRAMYFLLADAKERFHYLSHALGAVLIFVGLKMTVSHWYHFPTYLSLAVIVIVIAIGVVASLRRTAGHADGSSEGHDHGHPHSGAHVVEPKATTTE